MRGFVGVVRAVFNRSRPPFGRPDTDQPRSVTLDEEKPILRFRLAAIFAAQLFDFVTFTIMIERHGIDAELNPIVALGF